MGGNPRADEGDKARIGANEGGVIAAADVDQDRKTELDPKNETGG